MRRVARSWLIILWPAVLAFGHGDFASASTSQRVPDGYYGVNYPAIGTDSDSQRRLHLAAIADSGLDEIRNTIHWNEIEPTAPTGTTHRYRFVRPDLWIGDAAREGLRTQATLTYTPDWNDTDDLVCNVFGAVSHGPNDLNAYALALEQMVRRYGPGGSFWDEHPSLPYRPVRTWEIWNEQNLTSYWCPAPDAHRYAEMFVLAAEAVKRIRPNASVVVGGMTLASPSGSAVDPGSFLRAAVAHRPALAQLADAVAVHVYPQGSIEQQLQVFEVFRDELRQGNVPDSTPMLVNEVGWSTGGGNPFSEAERVDRYRLVTRDLPRTNCNVSGMVAHAWTTREQNRNQETDFYGIASPASGALYPAGAAFADTAALMLGRTADEPPTSELHTCDGMPPLDRDEDGVPDEEDYFPIDPDRDHPPGGGGTPGAGCSQDLMDLTLRVVSTDGAQHRTALAQYRSGKRRCIPCVSRLHKLKKRVASAGGRRRQVLRKRRRNLSRRCAPCLNELTSLQGAWLAATSPEAKSSIVEQHDTVRLGCDGN
jgi:hypothetical protein